MRILITGSAGKIGKELIKVLHEHELLLVDKKDSENGSVKCNLATDDLEFIKKFEPEVVVHLAASFERTDETRQFHGTNWEDNILASYRLNRLIGELGIAPKQYVFASSYLVYDPMLYLSDFPLKVPTELSECHELNPRNLIGASKLYIEKEIDYLQRNFHPNMKVCHARIFRVYGEGGQEFVSRVIEWKKMGIPVDIWKPENRFDFIHTSDCASAIKAMIDKGLNGPYNVGYGVATSIKQILDIVKPEIRRVHVEDKYEWSVAYTWAMEEDAGWAPKVNLLNWIEEKMK